MNWRLRGCHCKEIDIWRNDAGYDSRIVDDDGMAKEWSKKLIERLPPPLVESQSIQIPAELCCPDSIHESGGNSISKTAESLILHVHTLLKSITLSDVCPTNQGNTVTDLSLVASLGVHCSTE